MRDENIPWQTKSLVKHNGTETCHSFCSVLTLCLGNENGRGEARNKKKSRDLENPNQTRI